MAAHPPARSWGAYARQFGVELQRLRLEAGITQEGLAHQIGVTRNYYQQLERGSLPSGKPTNPSLKVVTRLSAVLDVRMDQLLPDPGSIEWE